MSKVFFTSDLHLGYEDVLDKSIRPFRNINQMTKTIIRNYNRRVSKNDLVYILGDMFYRNVYKENKVFIHKCLQSLNGRKILIMGNHDKWAENEEFRNYFEYIGYNLTIYHESNFIYLSHKPCVNKKMKERNFHLYGHLHDKEEILYNKFRKANFRNVGVDFNDFYPVTFDELNSFRRDYKLG